MAQALTRFRTLLPFRKRHILAPEPIQQPFYEAIPPWWLKFSWVMAGAGIFMGFTMSELAWREWSVRIDPTDSKSGKEEWELRPIWQRGLFAAVHASLGVGLAALIIGARSRYVHRLHVIPANVAPEFGGSAKRLFVQSAIDGKGGTIFPFHSTRIYPGRDNTEVILRVDDKKGHWWIGTKNVRIQGEGIEFNHAREKLMNLWGIKKGDDATTGQGAVATQERSPMPALAPQPAAKLPSSSKAKKAAERKANRVHR